MTWVPPGSGRWFVGATVDGGRVAGPLGEAVVVAPPGLEPAVSLPAENDPVAALIWAAARNRCAPSLPVLPPGDIVVIYAAAVRACVRVAAAARSALSVQVPGGGAMAALLKRAAAGALSVESSLGTWRISGLMFLSLVFSFLLIFLSKMMFG